jgi:hypothetical protein
MKKLLPILLFCFSCIAYAQEDSKDYTIINKQLAGDSNYNEFKVNALYAILGAIEFNYERTLNKRSAVGLSVFLPYDKDQIDNIDYLIGPYYRYYFGKNYAAGFFLEGFGLVNHTRQTFPVANGETFRTDLTLGIGFGGKWVSESGFVGELSLGFGRNVFDPENDTFEILGRIGITIGYRF